MKNTPRNTFHYEAVSKRKNKYFNTYSEENMSACPCKKTICCDREL